MLSTDFENESKYILKYLGFSEKNMFEIKSNLFYIPYELQSRKQNVLQMRT